MRIHKVPFLVRRVKAHGLAYKLAEDHYASMGARPESVHAAEVGGKQVIALVGKIQPPYRR